MNKSNWKSVIPMGTLMFASTISTLQAASEAASDTAATASVMAGWQLVLLTAILTTVGTWFVTRYQLRQEAEAQATIRKEELERHGRYLAIRVVCALDTFVNGCGDVVYDDGMLGNEHETVPREPTPTLNFPDDVDWKTVDPDLMYRALSLPNEIASADQAIDWVLWQIATSPDHEDFFTERVLRYGQLGLSALKLADDLRARYGIPARNTDGWHPRETLEKRAKEAEQEKAEAAAESARTWNEMNNNVESKAPKDEA
jgi:hypothetical protein